MSYRNRRGLVSLACAALFLSAWTGTAAAHPGPEDGGVSSDDSARDAKQHGTTTGHLPASTSNVELVSKLRLKNVEPGGIADVSVYKGFAYVAAWGGQTCDDNGIHVVDIRKAGSPREVGFIRSKVGSYPGEGVQVTHVDTPSFTGDLLVTNNEKCNENTGYGGVNLYDVTNPLRPTKLFEGAGDQTLPGVKRKQANEIHSAFAWDAGTKAYAVLVDNEEGADVDILDISNPRAPRFLVEYDLDQKFPQILQGAPSNLTEVFLHDMVVKTIGGRQVMLASYWDAGYVKLDVTDPTNITYLGDTDFTNPDPELLESRGRTEKPEGNAHQAEFSLDNSYVIGADEDFSPNGTEGKTDDDPNAFLVSQGSDTPQLQDGQSLTGSTVYVGRACTGDAAVPPAPSGTGAQIAVITRGLCTFTEKIANVEAAGGYEGAIVINREGSDGCGAFGMSVDGDIPAFSVDRRTGYGFFDRQGSYDEKACLAGAGSLIPGVPLGALGDVVTVRAFFDGWGYVHLFRNQSGKMAELDTYAIDEAHDPTYAQGFGDLSVHEVATSKARPDLAYLSYYAGGLRVVKIVAGELVEVGRFIDQDGNNFWGVEAFSQAGQEYVAASDRDFGLYIFKYTGSN